MPPALKYEAPDHCRGTALGRPGVVSTLFIHSFRRGCRAAHASITKEMPRSSHAQIRCSRAMCLFSGGFVEGPGQHELGSNTGHSGAMLPPPPDDVGFPVA